jgi:5-methylcytosine-specific restriction endonuclease McrA
MGCFLIVDLAKVLRLKSTRKRNKKKGNGIFYISEKEITKLLSSNCYICQINPSEHLDHIVPISKGGTHSIGNLLGSCQRCNLEKGSKTLYEYKRLRATREVLRPL